MSECHHRIEAASPSVCPAGDQPTQPDRDAPTADTSYFVGVPPVGQHGVSDEKERLADGTVRWRSVVVPRGKVDFAGARQRPVWVTRR